MPAVGFSVATNSLVGKYIGAGQPDTAVARTRLTLGLAMAYMTACAAIFLIFRRELISIFIAGSSTDPAEAAQIIDIGAKLMICTAVFQTADAVGVIFSGALRGAGDTVWPGVVTLIYSWVFIVGGGALSIAVWPGLQSVGPWLAAAIYIMVYGLTMWLRFTGGHWRSINLLKGAHAEAAALPPIVPGPVAADAAAATEDLAAPLTAVHSGGFAAGGQTSVRCNSAVQLDADPSS
jgi:MATE family multidrug resistance protein